MLFPLLSDQFVQSCFTVPRSGQPNHRRRFAARLRHQQTVSIGFQFPLLVRVGHFVSRHHFAGLPAIRLRHLYYRTNAVSLSEWNCDTCDISWQSERSSITGAAQNDFAWRNPHSPTDSGLEKK